MSNLIVDASFNYVTACCRSKPILYKGGHAACSKCNAYFWVGPGVYRNNPSLQSKSTADGGEQRHVNVVRTAKPCAPAKQRKPCDGQQVLFADGLDTPAKSKHD